MKGSKKIIKRCFFGGAAFFWLITGIRPRMRMSCDLPRIISYTQKEKYPSPRGNELRPLHIDWVIHSNHNMWTNRQIVAFGHN